MKTFFTLWLLWWINVTKHDIKTVSNLDKKNGSCLEKRANIFLKTYQNVRETLPILRYVVGFFGFFFKIIQSYNSSCRYFLKKARINIDLWHDLVTFTIGFVCAVSVIQNTFDGRFLCKWGKSVLYLRNITDKTLVLFGSLPTLRRKKIV